MYLVIIKVRDILFFLQEKLNNAKSCAYNGHRMVMENDYLQPLNLKYIYYICFNLISNDCMQIKLKNCDG